MSGASRALPWGRVTLVRGKCPGPEPVCPVLLCCPVQCSHTHVLASQSESAVKLVGSKLAVLPPAHCSRVRAQPCSVSWQLASDQSASRETTGSFLAQLETCFSIWRRGRGKKPFWDYYLVKVLEKDL